MRRRAGLGFFLTLGAFWALGLATGCGGGGSSSSASTEDIAAQSQENSVVVGYDHNGDGYLDMLTLDLGAEPLTILEALEGDGQGGYVDRTDALAGQAIDTALSASIKDYVASTIELGGQTELELTDTSGNSVLVVIYQ